MRVHIARSNLRAWASKSVTFSSQHHRDFHALSTSYAPLQTALAVNNTRHKHGTCAAPPPERRNHHPGRFYECDCSRLATGDLRGDRDCALPARAYVAHLSLIFHAPSYARMLPDEVKAGYPPRPLTIVPELPVDSLGLKQGEQLVVTQRPTSGHQAFQAASSTAFPAPSPAAAMTGLTTSQTRDSPRPAVPAATSVGKGGLDYVLTNNGYLMHRVSVCCPG